MARLKKELVLEREAFARELLKTMDVPAANEKLAAKYGGMKMAIPRMLELKAEVSGVKPTSTKAVSQPVEHTGILAPAVLDEHNDHIDRPVSKQVKEEKVPFRIEPVQPSPFDDPMVQYEIEKQRASGIVFPKVYLPMGGI